MMDMPDEIYAGIVSGYEDHGFGGCCWGTGDKYVQKQSGNPGGVYYSRAKVKEMVEQAHMAGQHNEGDGVDPSYSNAKQYTEKALGA